MTAAGWFVLIGMLVSWAAGWGMRDVHFHTTQESMKADHKAAIKDLEAEIRRLRTQVAQWIGTPVRVLGDPVALGTCCGDATHGCCVHDDPTARMHG